MHDRNAFVSVVGRPWPTIAAMPPAGTPPESTNSHARQPLLFTVMSNTRQPCRRSIPDVCGLPPLSSRRLSMLFCSQHSRPRRGPLVPLGPRRGRRCPHVTHPSPLYAFCPKGGKTISCPNLNWATPAPTPSAAKCCTVTDQRRRRQAATEINPTLCVHAPSPTTYPRRAYGRDHRTSPFGL